VLTGFVFHTDGLQLTATAVCFWEQELRIIRISVVCLTTWRWRLRKKASSLCLSG